MMKTLVTVSLMLVLGSAMADQCCCCGGGAGFKVPALDSKDAKFLAQANMMLAASESKGDMKMGDAYRMYVAGHGYQKFCCMDMANAARKSYMAKGVKVGKVQKIAKRR
jgi:hypothetical protein